MSRSPATPGIHEAHFSAGGRHAARETDPASEDGMDVRGEDRALLLASVARDARLDRRYLLLITLSGAIATLGLLQNSPAVVIGAMLVSPLLGPIMGVGFGLATLDSGLIRRSLGTLGAGVLIAVLTAMLLIWLSPIQDVTAEIRARTQPTLLDLGVAVVGGVAGVYAILRRLSGVMVGVAIATALVPPLSTIGFGLATWRPELALGAALLFLTNSLAIAVAATIVARINRFGPSLTPKHTVFQVAGILVTMGLLALPLALSLNAIVRELTARSTVQTQLTALLGPNDRIDTLTVAMEDGKVKVDGVVLVERYRADLPQNLMRRTSRLLERSVAVHIAQLQPQSPTAVQSEDRLNQRLAELERRSRNLDAMRIALLEGGLLRADEVVIDPMARRVLILRPAPAEDDAADDEQTDPLTAYLAEVRATYPGWTVERLAARSDRPEGAATPSPR